LSLENDKTLHVSEYVARKKKPVGLWCLTRLSTIFQLFIMAVTFIGVGNRNTMCFISYVIY